MGSSSTMAAALREPERLHFSGSIKLQDHHRARTAIVYVRQSSMHQVQDNTESTERQYALVHRAVALGWAGNCVEVIDEDQGRSGTTAEGRLGFQRLLAEAVPLLDVSGEPPMSNGVTAD
jgi:Resolvase, N terminal domain